jgi:DNA (cytosine-5)-methyltransferase 1
VAGGIKDSVKRLKALGNAVVPAQAFPIFRAIAEIEKGALLVRREYGGTTLDRGN